MPTLVPKPGLPTITQQHLPGREIAAIHALESRQIMLDCEICSLKIHGGRKAQLSSDVWCDFPRVGVLGPQKEEGPEPAIAC